VKLLTFLFLGTVVAALETSAQSQTTRGSCPASQVTRDSAPADPNADSGGGPANWYVNSDRTIWAGPVPEGGWPSGGTLFSGDGMVKGQKTYWVRPQGKQLAITGRRIDTNGPPVEAHIPCCYPTGFQIVALYFPTQGCWEVSAKAGDNELRFVTEVKQSIVDSRQ
jgi:hypothetical protein